MAQSQHPLAVMIGIGKKPSGGPPPPKWDDEQDPQAAGSGQDAQDSSDQQKVSPEDAHCFTGEQRCSTCEYYIHEGHMCQKVDGNTFGTEIVGCVDFWEPQGGSGEPDEDDMAPAPAVQGEQYGGSNTTKSGY